MTLQVGENYLQCQVLVGDFDVGSTYRPPMTSLGTRIRIARNALKLTQADLAAPFGIARTNVTAWEKDDTRPDQAKLEPLAQMLGVDVAWLLTGAGDAPGTTPPQAALGSPRHQPDDRVRVQAIPGTELIVPGPADLPVYAAAQGGDGHMIVTFDAIDWVKRPEPLRNVKGGYGLLVTGTSMIPAYRSGDIALVNPHLAPMRETDVILYHSPPDAEAEAMIKGLVAYNDREWTLEQYNPAQTFTMFRKEWPICHRCVGKYARR